ncbi:unnamed protein product [Rotaria magnacalcarata]
MRGTQIICSSYLEALIIDPVIDTIGRNAKLIPQLGLKLQHVVNTHVHTDHFTRSGKLKTLFPECKSVLSNESKAKADVHLPGKEKLELNFIQKTYIILFTIL